MNYIITKLCKFAMYIDMVVYNVIDKFNIVWLTLFSYYLKDDCKKHTLWAECGFGHNFWVLTPNDLKFLGKVLMTIIQLP